MGKRLTQIATRTGDDGTTGLGDGSRTDKDSLRIAALGDVDELNSTLGLLLTEPLPDAVRAQLTDIQHDLFDLGGELCIPGFENVAESQVARLDALLEAHNATLPRLEEFILPGGSRAAAIAHVARTVCRRAERAVVALCARRAGAPAVPAVPEPAVRPDVRAGPRAQPPRRRQRRALDPGQEQVTSTLRRRLLGALPAAVGAATLPGLASAQGTAWPARAVRLVVPFPPGGTTDLVTRLVGHELSQAWGQPVVIENKPGAGTVLGVDTVAKAAPDGHTFVTVANSFTANQTLVKRLPYDPLRDLRPVALMAQSEHLLAAHPSLPVRTAAELVAYAKANPGKLAYASFGNGTSAHLSGELLKQQAGIDLVHVPYRGQGPALQDLLAGQVQLMFGNLPEFLPYVREGRLRALGLAMPRRSGFAPELPTLAEQGLRDIESTSWFGLLAPARVPDAIVAKLNADVNAAMALPAMREAFARASLTALPGTPEEFGRFMRTETERYARVIRSAGITID